MFKVLESVSKRLLASRRSQRRKPEVRSVSGSRDTAKPTPLSPGAVSAVVTAVPVENSEFSNINYRDRSEDELQAEPDRLWRASSPSGRPVIITSGLEASIVSGQ